MSVTESSASVTVPQATAEQHHQLRLSSLSQLVANFARAHILIALFDGDPEKWMDFISREGTVDEREHDIPFLLDMRERMSDDPEFVHEMRRTVSAFSSLFDR